MEEEQHCAISTQWQRSCQTDDETGQMRCETLKRTYRLCPGRQPEIVKEERVDEAGTVDKAFRVERRWGTARNAAGATSVVAAWRAQTWTRKGHGVDGHALALMHASQVATST